jgi:hypothetical protein
MRLRGSAFFLTFLLVATTSCAPDRLIPPSAATPSTTSATALLPLVGATTVVPLKRLVSLETETASATIGVLGGQLSLPRAGLTVVVPPFALTAPTTITVTALGGMNVAYDFAPKGQRFNIPLVATQDLTVTEAAAGGLVNPASLFVGYFPNDNRITLITEILNPTLNLLAQTSTVSISHFSGYIWSSGQETPDSAGTGASLSIKRNR